MKKLFLSICAFALSLAMLGCVHTTTRKAAQISTYTKRQWTPVYNDHVCGIMSQWVDSECASQKELTTEEMQSVLPGKQVEGAAYTAKADLREDGSVLRLRIWIKKGDAEAFVAIGSDSYRFACCVSREPEAKSSLCGDLQYKIYRKDNILFAETVCNEYPVLISVRADAKAVGIGENGMPIEYKMEDIELERPLFEEVLEHFSWYDNDEPNLDAIVSGVK